MIKISVIIPVYNKEKYLSQSIESVLNQTYENFELILINDGSTDNSSNIIKKYSKIDTRIKYIGQKNQGVSATRNNGIKASSGEYISFLDADDLYRKEFLRSMVDKIGNRDSCFCGYAKLKGNTIKENRLRSNSKDYFMDYMSGKMKIHTNSWLIKKSFLDKKNILFDYDLKWGEDMLFFSKVLLTGKSCILNENLTIYREDVDGALSTNTLNKIEEDILWVERLISYINKNDIENKQAYIKMIQNYRLPALIVYRLYSNLNIEKKDVIAKKYDRNYKYIKNKSNINGLRSIKLNLYHYKLKKELRTK